MTEPSKNGASESSPALPIVVSSSESPAGAAVKSWQVLGPLIALILAGAIFLLDRIDEKAAAAVDAHAKHPHEGVATSEDIKRLEKKLDSVIDRLEKGR